MHVLRASPRLNVALASVCWLAVVPCYGQTKQSTPPAKPQHVLGPESKPPAIQHNGPWVLDAKGLRPAVNNRQPKGGYALVATEAALIADAFVTARLGAHKAREARLLLRATRTPHRVEAALVVEMVGRWVWFSEVRKGRLRRISRKRKLWRVGKTDAIDVDVLLAGQHGVASFFNHTTNDHLGTISAQVDLAGPGAIGLMRPRRVERAAPLTQLSLRPTCSGYADARDPLPLFAIHLAEADRSQGKEHATAALEQLPGNSPTDPPILVWQIHRQGLEKLLCAKVQVLRVQTDLPFKYRDLAYLKYREQPPTATATGYQLDLSYKDPQMVEALLRGWQKRYPKVSQLVRIGRSNQGQALWALSVGRRRNAPAILVNGAHHGEEILSVEFVLDAIQWILAAAEDDPRVQAWLSKLRIVFVPLVNPDGLNSFLKVSREGGRKNGFGLKGKMPQRSELGVDLNRNYPIRWGASGERGSKSSRRSRFYRGPAAASESETRAMMRLAHREHFAASLSFHTGTVALLPPYTIPKMRSPQPNECDAIAQILTQDLPEHPQKGLFEIKRMLYPVEGTDQDWLRYNYGTVALLVEGARWSPVDSEERRKIIEAVRPLWQRLLDRVVNGPTLTGRVVDQEGRALRAEVRLVQQRLREGEKWFSRCRDGRFTRLLPKAGSYTVEVRYPGTSPVRKTIRVGKGLTRMTITVPVKRKGTQCSKLAFSAELP